MLYFITAPLRLRSGGIGFAFQLCAREDIATYGGYMVGDFLDQKHLEPSLWHLVGTSQEGPVTSLDFLVRQLKDSEKPLRNAILE